MYTKLQTRILEFFFKKAGKTFNQRQIANRLNVSPTAVSKAIKEVKELIISKDEETKRKKIQLNRDLSRTIYLKRVNNLKQLYESNLVEHLSNKFPGSTIILFGSYSRGEDIFNSDIDIAIIGEIKKLNLKNFEEKLKRKIQVFQFKNFEDIKNKELKNNIINGCLLNGRLKL